MTPEPAADGSTVLRQVLKLLKTASASTSDPETLNRARTLLRSYLHTVELGTEATRLHNQPQRTSGPGKDLTVAVRDLLDTILDYVTLTDTVLFLLVLRQQRRDLPHQFQWQHRQLRTQLLTERAATGALLRAASDPTAR